MWGVWLLLFSITAVIGNGIFAFTDLAWRLSGAPTESYPEILYAAYFFPTSVLLLIDSTLLLWTKKPLPQNELWLAANAKLVGLGLLSLLFYSRLMGNGRSCSRSDKSLSTVMCLSPTRFICF